MRHCGPCKACCIEPSIAKEGVILEDKPAKTPCSNLCSGGCSVYKQRPTICRSFTCAWLAGLLPFSYRPDKLGLMITGHKIEGFEIALIHELWKGARKEIRAKAVIEHYAMNMLTMLIDNNLPDQNTTIAGPIELQQSFYTATGQERLREVILNLPPNTAGVQISLAR